MIVNTFDERNLINKNFDQRKNFYISEKSILKTDQEGEKL